MPFRIVPKDGRAPIQVHRELWFDQDIDGKWLVVASKDGATGPDGDHDYDADVGAIVVTDPRVVAFIELLGELVADPARFAHEPRFEADA
jgi:hypothetical protein